MKKNNFFWQKFKQNRKAFWSFNILIILAIISIFAEFIANEKPILVKFNQHFYFPIFKDYPETTFGGKLLTSTDYRDEFVEDLINENGYIIFAPIRYSPDTINLKLIKPAPSKPTLENLLGTDDQARDVLARIIYAIRISLSFGMVLSFFSLIIGIYLGAIQGYFAGKLDLFMQRFIEIWSSLPLMFLLIIFSSVIQPGFFSLLLIMLLFSWVGVVSFVRAEFLRIRNFDYIKASRALGAGSSWIILRQILPNATPIILANLPFLVASSITSLTALDFLGMGLEVGAPSLGELLSQGKNNITAYWLGISGFLVTTLVLSILVFISEGLRDAFDYNK
ncbi:MAG: ABC transporter permease [Alphaproteobacteria bacterium]